jgi:signal transduction histidine kinase
MPCTTAHIAEGPDVQAASPAQAGGIEPSMPVCRVPLRTLANLVHELRTPLSGMLGLSRMMALGENLSDEQRRLLALIDECGGHQLQLINDILDCAMLDAGQMRLQPTLTPLSPLLDNLCAALVPEASERRTYLSVVVADDVPALVRLDPVRLRQVLFSVVGNALKQSGGRSVRIAVALQPHTRHLQFSVVDTGVGIAAEQLAQMGRMFERSYGTNDVCNGNGNGNGIGLAVTRQLLALMGSKLQIVSPLGEGTRVSFALAQY